MEKEKNLIELVDLQHKLIKGFANLVEPWLSSEENQIAPFHAYLFSYMDLISAHILENRVPVPKNILDEVGEWTANYDDDEMEAMFILYHEVMDELIHSKKDEEVSDS